MRGLAHPRPSGKIPRYDPLAHPFTYSQLSPMYMIPYKANWTTLDQKTTSNLLSVVAVLPYSCKRQISSTNNPFPILEVLEFIFKNPLFKVKFAPIVASWL